MAQDNTPLTAQDLASVQFQMGRRSGYEVLDVDSFLDQAQAAWSGSPAERETFQDTIATVQFRMARRSGYEVTQVDAFLDRLSAAFGAEDTASEPSPELRAEVHELGLAARRPRGGRFTTTKVFSGLQFSAVDQLVDDAVGALFGDEPTSLDLSTTDLPTSRPGYRRGEVEEWLRAVERHLQRP